MSLCAPMHPQLTMGYYVPLPANYYRGGEDVLTSAVFTLHGWITAHSLLFFFPWWDQCACRLHLVLMHSTFDSPFILGLIKYLASSDIGTNMLIDYLNTAEASFDHFKYIMHVATSPERGSEGVMEVASECTIGGHQVGNLTFTAGKIWWMFFWFLCHLQQWPPPLKHKLGMQKHDYAPNKFSQCWRTDFLLQCIG